MVKNLPAMHKSQVQSLDLEDPQEKEIATYPSYPAWEIQWTEKLKSTCGLKSMGLQKSQQQRFLIYIVS